MRLCQRVKATVESREHQSKTSHYVGSRGRGVHVQLVGHHKELGIFCTLASIQKVELLGTCVARIFLLTIDYCNGLGWCARNNALKPGSLAQLKKITIIIVTGLDFAVKIWAANTLKKEEKLMTCKENSLACNSFSWLLGKAPEAQRAGTADAQTHTSAILFSFSIMQMLVADQVLSCPCMPLWSRTVLVSLKFLVENTLPWNCPWSLKH